MKQIVKRIIPDNILDVLRLIRQRRHQERLLQKSKKSIRDLINLQLPIMLELGAGAKKGTNGWTTIDIHQNCDIYWDLLLPLPFPDNSVTKIYSSHVLEHFFYPDLMKILIECYRVLKPNGVLSVCVPDATIYLNAYFDPGYFNSDKYCLYKPAFYFNSRIDYINYIAYMAGHHRYMFDDENLLIVLKNSGFKNTRLRCFDSKLDRKDRDHESIYAIGVK